MASQTMAREVELKSVSIERYNAGGDVLGSADLDPEVFGRTPNVSLLHQVVTAQLAARRAGTQSTKTRAEVSGGGAKPYRQKGTGRARQGTVRAPQFTGGGVALGPKPRSYEQRTPRKMTRLALYSALSDRAAEGRVRLVDRWSFSAPRTKDAIAAMNALELDGNVLVVLGPDDSVAERSFANLSAVDLVEAGQLTAYDVLVNDWIVFTDATLPGSVSLSEVGQRKHAPVMASASEAKLDDEALVTPAVAAEDEPAGAADDRGPAGDKSSDIAEADIQNEADTVDQSDIEGQSDTVDQSDTVVADDEEESE
jgi:large subunit ribosomal protein L4